MPFLNTYIWLWCCPKHNQCQRSDRSNVRFAVCGKEFLQTFPALSGHRGFSVDAAAGPVRAWDPQTSKPGTLARREEGKGCSESWNTPKTVTEPSLRAPSRAGSGLGSGLRIHTGSTTPRGLHFQKEFSEDALDIIGQKFQYTV